MNGSDPYSENQPKPKLLNAAQAIMNDFTGLIQSICRQSWGNLKNNKLPILLIVIVISIPWLVRTVLLQDFFIHSKQIAVSQEDSDLFSKQIDKEIKALDKKLAAKTPKSFYLIINSSANVFYLYKGTQLIKNDKCSTGSYIMLKSGDAQQWIFKTPKGEFKIRGKITSPVWKKPDWAFIEEGLAVPPSNHSSRFEYGVLGDYALSLGHGYLIHGTLYQRFLGLPVTHGCIRLNDENLELVYSSLSIGSKVYIY